MADNRAPLTFKDFFPNKTVTTIKSGSELFLAYSLDKYCVALLGRRFSISGLAIDKHILKSGYMAFLKHNAYLTDVPLPFTPEEETAWLNSFRWQNYFSSSVQGVKYVSASDTEILYSFVNDVPENRVMNTATGTAYVSLVAYTLVANYRLNKKRMLIINNDKREPHVGEYTDLLILRDFGNKLISSDICTFIYAESEERQPEYEAYVGFNQQRGYMSRVYSPSEKFRVCGHTWKVGDPVLVYKKRELYKKSRFKPLNSCCMGVIRHIDKSGITIEEVPCAETRLTQLRQMEVRIARNPSCYSTADKYNWSTSKAVYSWDMVGIGVCTYDESVMITEIFDEDGCNQWVSDGETEKVIWMGTPDVVYAVLTDHSIAFNKDEFVTKMFTSRGRTPVFDQYVNNMPIKA